MLQIHSVEHSYGLGGESLRETFTICIMYANMHAVCIMHIYILLYIMLQIHSVEHSYGLGGESLRETFTICIMHRSLLAV